MMPSLYSRVEKAINTVDAGGLLALGAPPDEYEGEILGIAMMLYHAPSPLRELEVDKVAEVIESVFEVHFFAGYATRAQCLQIAELILKDDHITKEPDANSAN